LSPSSARKTRPTVTAKAFRSKRYTLAGCAHPSAEA
jgi:hypothetical protein